MRSLRRRYSRCRPGRAPIPSVMSPTNQAYHAEYCLFDGGMSDTEYRDACKGEGNWKSRRYGGDANDNPQPITDKQRKAWKEAYTYK